MAYVQVTVVDPEGNQFVAEVDANASLDAVTRGLVKRLGLSPVGNYRIRNADKIREGVILIIDEIPARSARLLSSG